MAFLTLFRVSTGDNWNGIMKVRAYGGSGPPWAGMDPRKQPHLMSQDAWAGVTWL